jgi:hypothetical protein
MLASIVSREDVMESVPLLDCAGRRRSPATLPSFHQDRAPRNKGLRYPPDPPTVEQIIAVMRAAGDHSDGIRLRGVIVVLWRAGLRRRAGAKRQSAANGARSAWTAGPWRTSSPGSAVRGVFSSWSAVASSQSRGSNDECGH